MSTAHTVRHQYWWWNTKPNPRPRSSPESVHKTTVSVLEQTADLAGIRQIGMAANLALFDAADW